jgi:hypothetical protein
VAEAPMMDDAVGRRSSILADALAGEQRVLRLMKDDVGSEIATIVY